MRISGVRNAVWLGVLVVVLVPPLYYFNTYSPGWIRTTWRSDPAPPSGNHTSAGSRPHKPKPAGIMFLESGGHGIITARMACAVESAATVHPNKVVRLLSVNADGRARRKISGPFVDLLRSFENVVVSDVKPAEEFQGTPLDSWYRSGVLNKSAYPAEHLADALRLAEVYKRGGIYLDIDVVVMKPLDSLPSFVSQSPVDNGDMVSNGFMGFHRGDPFLLELMNHIPEVYKPQLWNSIGPLLLRNVTLAYCGKKSVRELVERRCGGNVGFTVLDHRKFLPVPYDSSEIFFAAITSKQAWNMCNGSYVMHVYGKSTSKVLTEPGSAYRKAAETYCPESLEQALKLNGTF